MTDRYTKVALATIAFLLLVIFMEAKAGIDRMNVTLNRLTEVQTAQQTLMTQLAELKTPDNQRVQQVVITGWMDDQLNLVHPLNLDGLPIQPVKSDPAYLESIKRIRITPPPR